ncbi:MAG: ATP-dependent metallopeptidase FtsH/Yme1/Tma family protein [Myxococcales bacterium]|nr:ATP-dependent metallopeptidase FtsH/Yme1/Tma family protein [Myxococcales bacterium]
MKQSTKTILLWVLLIGVFFLIYNLFAEGSDSREVTYFQLISDIEQKRLAPDEDITIDLKDNRYEYVVLEQRGDKTVKVRQHAIGLIDPAVQDRIEQALKAAGQPLAIRYRRSEDSGFWTSVLVSWLPMLLIFGLFFVFLRQMQAGGGRAMSFGKSKARLLTERKNKITFADVAGIDEAREELEEIIEFLRDPKKFTRLGGRIPKGVLLMGPPGTGKTLLARAIAGEAGVPFFTISGSDFVEMFVGVGAARVRDLFEQGKKNAPCIIFIDEIDAVGRHRGAGLGGGHDEREQTLNQLLVEMDGFEGKENVIIVAATNRPDVLDPALLRPGRFDRRIVVPLPDVRGREGILKVHTGTSRKVPLGDDVGLSKIARGTPGFSGADLENLVNEAALAAARKDRKFVVMEDFEAAKDKVLMGSERRSMIISEKEKRTTAWHEAGHTLVARMIPGSDPVHKVTIIPRGRALGVTQQLPTEDRLNISREFALDQITVLMGGRVAEEVVLKQQTTGAKMDIEHASEIARKMVCEWGMSEKLGPLAFGRKEEAIFLGREIAQHQDYSEQTAIEIDAEVKRIVMECYERARRLVTENLDRLERIAKALLEHESLDGDDIDALIDGRPLPERWSGPSAPAGAEASARRGEETRPSGGLLPGRPREVPSTG